MGDVAMGIGIGLALGVALGLVSKGSKRNGSALADPTYQPLNVLKPVCPDVWIVDGPLIGFGALGIRLPFPTRMTIVRLEEGLFIHSPTVLSSTLREAIDDLGTPQWIIGPNTIHYWWVGEWKRAFPNACVFLAPGIHKRARRRVDYPFVTLDHDTAWPWCRQLRTWVIHGSGITEVDFFHHASKTRSGRAGCGGSSGLAARSILLAECRATCGWLIGGTEGGCALPCRR